MKRYPRFLSAAALAAGFLTVSASAVTYPSTQSGTLGADATWGGASGNPSSVNTDTWQVQSGHTVTWDSVVEGSYNGTVEVLTGGKLQPFANGDDAIFNNLTLNGGSFQSVNNSNIDVTVNGVLHFAQNTSSLNWRGGAAFNGSGSITGSGDWDFSKNNANGANDFSISNLDMSSYTGTLNITNPGVTNPFNFSLNGQNMGNFGLSLTIDGNAVSSTWDLLNQNYTFTSLIIEGTTYTPGVYDVSTLVDVNDKIGDLTLANFASSTVTVVKAPWPGDFDSLAVGTGDLVVNANPVFGSATPDVATEQWAVGSSDFSVVDSGAGDHVLRLSNTNSSRAAAIWLDVSELELAPGEYRMQFTVSGYALSGGEGTLPKQFANVVKAQGVDASTADTVTWSLSRGNNFDPVTSAGAATVATNGAYGSAVTVHSAGGGATFFTADGTVTHSFTIVAGDEYIGLIIGNQDIAGQTAAFAINDVTVEAVTLLLEPTITASTLVIAPAGTVDLTITFDPAADTAELTDSLGSPATDLIALDGDADGVVALTGLTPAATLNYTVTTINTVDTKDVTARVGVFTEPSDNAFTTALLADSPEFFYRFEEPADALFLYDSSGNDHHTTAILGESGLTQGVSEGGIGQGARLDGSVRIQSPAISNWNQNFSLALVVSVDDVLSGQSLIAKDKTNVGVGGIQGRGVLGLREDPNALHTNIGDGGSVEDSSGNLLPNDIRCLVHMTYDDIANEVSYYVNGTLWSTESKTVNDDHTGPWNIAGGANQGKTTGNLDGIMDEAALFIKTLNAGEVTAHYNAFLAAGDPLMGGNIDIDSFRAGESVTVTYKLSDQATGVTLGGVAQSLTSGLNVATIQPLAEGTVELEVSGPGGPYVESFNVSVTQPQMSIAIDSVSPGGSSAFTVTVDNELLEYRLLRNTDLSSESFAPTGASAQPVSADPGDLSFSLQDGSSPADKAFYRIDYVLP